MSELYWLTTLSTLSVFSCTIASLFGVIMAISIIAIFICEAEEEKDVIKTWKHVRKLASWIFGVTILPALFIPSKTDLYLIYGIGGTIDYIQSNPKAKQLPDKVINACNIYLDNMIEDQKTKKK